MVKLKSKIIILIVFISIAALLIGYNIYSVERQKIEARLEEEREKLEKEMLEELKSRETIELAEYYQKYAPIKAEFIGKAAELSAEAQDIIINTTQLKELTSERLDAAKDYRGKLTAIDTPEPLETFLVCELDFIESDIETIGMVLSYYGSESYSTYDDSELKELYRKTDSLLLKAGEELHRVYSQYELGYLLE